MSLPPNPQNKLSEKLSTLLRPAFWGALGSVLLLAPMWWEEHAHSRLIEKIRRLGQQAPVSLELDTTKGEPQIDLDFRGLHIKRLTFVDPEAKHTQPKSVETRFNNGISIQETHLSLGRKGIELRATLEPCHLKFSKKRLSSLLSKQHNAKPETNHKQTPKDITSSNEVKSGTKSSFKSASFVDDIPTRLTLEGSLLFELPGEFLAEFERLHASANNGNNLHIEIQNKLSHPKLDKAIYIPLFFKQSSSQDLYFKTRLPSRLVGSQTTPHDPRELRLEGQISAKRIQTTIAHEDQSTKEATTLQIESTSSSASAGPPSSLALTLDAKQLPLNLLGIFLGEGSSSINLDDAQLNGRVQILSTQTLSDTSVVLNEASIQGFKFDSPFIAPTALEFGPLTATGSFEYKNNVTSPAWLSANLNLEHHQLRSQLKFSRSASLWAIDFSFPTMECQELFDSLPHDLLPALQGMRFDGQVAGQLKLDIQPDELERFEELPELGPDVSDPLDPLVSSIHLDFPFQENCKIVRSAPDIRVNALKDSYRHRFRRGDGQTSERVLSTSSPHFVPLYRIPKLALAFTILEDARFWHHDGFDREQILRAFWNNLRSKGFRRGASTISQQTARSLWLGTQRKLSRKLQEALLTVELETALSKRQILETYLNLVELAPQLYGVRDTAKALFDLEPEKLSLLQAVHIASLAPAPSTYAKRWCSGEVDAAWMQHLHHQIDRMEVRGLITKSEANRAKHERLNLKVRRCPE